MTGYLEIARLRAEAQKALGARFDRKQFHDRVLENERRPPFLFSARASRRGSLPRADSSSPG